jgi:oxygen-dependent protoporphyrinogen oxidase
MQAEYLTSWRVAVVGGGFSGLAAANRLIELCRHSGRPLDLTLFEAGPHLGGLVGTRQIAGYRVETGADSFITNKPWGLDLCRRLGLEARLIPTEAAFRRSLVVRRGHPVPVPEGFQLLGPTALGAVWRTSLLNWWGKLRLALEYFIPRAHGSGDESLGHFVRRRFGRQALERIVQPLVGGIYTADPEKLSLMATMPRFLEMEREYGSVIRGLKRQARNVNVKESAASGARYGLFVTLKNGISELIDALARSVGEGGRVVQHAEVTQVIPEGNAQGFALEFADGGKDNFDAVILALPAYRAAALIEPFTPGAARLLREIEYASTAIVVSGHKLADVKHPLDAFGLVVPAIERRRILAVSFTSRKFAGRAPPGCVQLRTFVGGAMQPELAELTEEELLRVVRQELQELLGVSWKPDFAIVARWMRSMPQYHVGHLERVAKIESELQPFARLALAGNAYRGVGVPDAIHSGEQAAEQLARQCAQAKLA